MSKIRKASDGRLLFYCEGCEQLHGVNNTWNFNENYDKPTFSPSILVRSTKFTEKGLADYEKWLDEGCPKEGAKVFENIPTICHSFVTDGKMQYLDDCTHKLAGKTVELLDEEKWFDNE